MAFVGRSARKPVFRTTVSTPDLVGPGIYDLNTNCKSRNRLWAPFLSTSARMNYSRISPTESDRLTQTFHMDPEQGDPPLRSRIPEADPHESLRCAFHLHAAPFGTSLPRFPQPRHLILASSAPPVLLEDSAASEIRKRGRSLSPLRSCRLPGMTPSIPNSKPVIISKS